MLFALQAAIGALIIGFFAGRYTKNKAEKQMSEKGGDSGNGGSRDRTQAADRATEAAKPVEKYYYR